MFEQSGSGETMSNTEETDEIVVDIPQSDVKPRREELIDRIEDVVHKIVISLARREKPYMSYDDGRDSGWNSNVDTEKEPRVKTLRFTGYKCRQRFALVMRVMSHAHDVLIKHLEGTGDEGSFYCTKRAFFYRLKGEHIKRFINNKKGKVEWAINEATMVLDCAPWEIGFYSTSKGLVAGDLSLHFGESKVVHYEQQSCYAVPNVVASITRVRTSAEFVLVVEKDSVFQKLVGENCAAYNKCIIVTGKGYPDVATRMFVHVLSEKTELPVYALVDANPHGFEIMCVYRFGTLNNMGYREQLLSPKMRWLGVHQNDLIRLGIPMIRLSPKELKKIEDLQNRSYVNADFAKHLRLMRRGKAEIESVHKPIENFLTEIFIPTKIRNKEYY